MFTGNIWSDRSSRHPFLNAIRTNAATTTKDSHMTITQERTPRLPAYDVGQSMQSLGYRDLSMPMMHTLAPIRAGATGRPLDRLGRGVGLP